MGEVAAEWFPSKEEYKMKLDDCTNQRQLTSVIAMNPFFALRYARLVNQARKRIAEIPQEDRSDQGYFAAGIETAGARVGIVVEEAVDKIVDPIVTNAVPSIFGEMSFKTKALVIAVGVGAVLWFAAPYVPMARDGVKQVKEITKK